MGQTVKRMCKAAQKVKVQNVYNDWRYAYLNKG